jgi:hypothetical protein
MKTRTNNNHQATQKRTPIPRKGSPRRSVDSRDLNGDDQTTNASTEEEGTDKKLHDVTLPSDRSVEEEEDRETKRKIADANPEDDIQN